MAQLINEDVKIYYLKRLWCQLSFSSEQCSLVKSIGDTADSIKGIKGVGESTLLTNFPELKKKSWLLMR
jgi:hypothetical protein